MPADNKFSIAQGDSARASLAPSESVYSDHLDEPLSTVDHPDMPHIPPLRVSKSKVKKPIHVPDHTFHHQQLLQDNGPRIKQSRLPIFKQVRSMLQKPSPLVTSGVNDASINTRPIGRAPDVGPWSNRQDAYGGTEEARRQRPPNRLLENPPTTLRAISPVSVLEDRDVQYEQLPRFEWDEPVSPVSSNSDISPDYYQIPIGPGQVSVNARTLPQTPLHPKMLSIKRKPAPREYSQASENIPPPPSPPYDGHYAALNSWRPSTQPKSHFSWTTGAPSIGPNSRPSMDTSNPTSRHSKDHGELHPTSRFSWSTVQTGMTHTMRPESPPPSPPPPVPSRYRAPPVQSILSRHRPIQRADKEAWTPPLRKTSLADHELYSGSPTSARSKITINSRPFTEHDNAGSSKKLPPPPELLTPAMSHKEVLLKEEQDKVHQRKNIERAIADLSKIENASPLDVSWEQVKDARTRIVELKSTLAEVQMEEREIGVAITRARRKEGEEEGLWVRRVTS
ncbi:hypothetical protein DOTSEDRAFT_73890 [Dothistroma septosporum NZE10]|uniref:Uncharacterized protein n=1 Tax=Dothistroma septosporum (strain NZE10 / CBS 128990) TaxID=675120 RepID=N1PHM3_DOTSN|nr:hypothetical protein DOTSEDRAFT_73890 [Dothistroma septosporum NZE10]